MNVQRKGIHLLKGNLCYLFYLGQAIFFVVLFIQE